MRTSFLISPKTFENQKPVKTCKDENFIVNMYLYYINFSAHQLCLISMGWNWSVCRPQNICCLVCFCIVLVCLDARQRCMMHGRYTGNNRCCSINEAIKNKKEKNFLLLRYVLRTLYCFVPTGYMFSLNCFLSNIQKDFVILIPLNVIIVASQINFNLFIHIHTKSWILNVPSGIKFIVKIGMIS